jgi:hypothetical protein
MMKLGENIDPCIRVVVSRNCYRHLLQAERYVDIDCRELTRAGYCLAVRPSGLPSPALPYLYKIYHKRDGRNVLTSSWT